MRLWYNESSGSFVLARKTTFDECPTSNEVRYKNDSYGCFLSVHRLTSDECRLSNKVRWHRIKTGMLVLASAGLLYGCGGRTTQPEEAGIPQTGEENTMEAEHTAEEVEALPLLTNYASEEELALSDPWSNCDDAALAEVMRRAEEGEPITVACIGGSITQGTIAAGTLDGELKLKTPYADLFHLWWEERFPRSEITFVNAGIGGTDSYLGVHRLERDVLSVEPDVVLVEYSVHDEDSNFYKCSYENLIRKLLLADKKPAVMLLYMAQTNGATAQNSHVLVGFHYNLPMVSYANCIKEMMAQEHYTAAQLSGDEVHPSAVGHAIVGEILWNYLNQVYEQKDSLPQPSDELAEPLTNTRYELAGLLDRKTLTPDENVGFQEAERTKEFPNGWVTEDGTGEITFTVDFKNLGILYQKTTDGKSGQYDVWIDGEKVCTLNADFTGGWGNAITSEEVYRSDTTGTHTVTIRKAEDSQGDTFILLGLLPS